MQWTRRRRFQKSKSMVTVRTVPAYRGWFGAQNQPPALLARPCNVAQAVPRSADPRRSEGDPKHWISQLCVFLEHVRKARRIDPIDPMRS